MAKKLYRTRQEFRYAPTDFYYAAGIEVSLDDWHPDDIKEALKTLITEVGTTPLSTFVKTYPETPPISKVEGPTKQPAEGTHSKDTTKIKEVEDLKELKNG